MFPVYFDINEKGRIHQYEDEKAATGVIFNQEKSG